MHSDLPIFPDLFATPWRFLWHGPSQTAILADLHLGSFAGVAGPRVDAGWSQVIARQPKQVIMAGDVCDQPESPPAVTDACRGMLGLLPRGCRVTLTPGNHDPADLAARLSIESAEFVQVAAYAISHGHSVPESLNPELSPHPARSLTWIVGHQHPAVTFRTRVQSAKMACYVVCNAGRQRPRMILLPAFSRDAGGPLGSNLQNSAHWLIPVTRPAATAMHIYGLIESATTMPQVLDFGILARLPRI